MNTAGNQALCSPLRLGELRLAHRIVMAPLTRSRATRPDPVPTSLMKTCDAQRAPQGGLIVTGVTNWSHRGRRFPGSAGLHAPRKSRGRELSLIHAPHAGAPSAIAPIRWPIGG